MKYLALAIILFSSTSFFAQETPDVRMHSLVLQAGDLFDMGTRSISFKEVISDSRCPKDVTCVWAGEAKVLLAIYENGKFLEEMIVSTSTGNIPLNFSKGDMSFSISGMKLTPYPTTRSKNTNPEYALQLMLKEE